MNLKEFYEKMQLSFLDSKVCEALCASGNNYILLVEGIKRVAPRIVKSINDEEPVKEDDINSLRNCLWILYSETQDLMYDGKQNYSEEEFNDYQKNVDKACNNFLNNCQVHIGEVVNSQEDDFEGPDLEDFDNTQTYSTKNDFNEIAKKLDKAKTRYNSGIYNNLVKAVENLDKETTVDTDKKLTNEQKYAVKLWAIKKQIDMYLEHKAQAGVKQNAYDKLVAVEELNKMVSERLQKLDVEKFMYGKHEVDINALKLTYNGDVAEQSAKKTKNAPNRLSMDAVNEMVESARELYKVDAKDFGNADDCMCRIIARAGKREQELIEMRSTFQKHPSREIKTAPTMQMNS